jgi:hypothetical protein
MPLNKIEAINLNLNYILLIKNNTCNYDKKHGPRVLCAIFAEKTTHKTKMMAIHETWSKRFIFY